MRNLTAYLFLLPNLTIFVVFLLVPLIWTLALSTQDGGMLGSLRQVGLRNYQVALRDPQFLTALRNTAQYAVMVIPSVIAIGLLLALLISQPIRGRDAFKSAIFFPQLAPVIVAATIWSFIVQPEYGPLNYPFHLFGATPPNWLGDPGLALPTITMVELWRGVGFYVVVYVAALASIPQTIYEAGMIDGAVGFKAFWHITLPLMKPTLLFTTVMATIWNFQLFDSVYILTQGGPVNSTITVAWYVYQSAFRYEKIGLAATMAVLLLVVILGLTLVQLKLLRSEEEYA